MKLIVGLGNPGEKFEDTRHNIGFIVVDRLARELSTKPVVWEESEKHKSLLFRMGDVMLVKPQTFMNNVGISIGSLVQFFKLDPADVWVIHDDIDLPMGKLRIRTAGGSAGHHGIESIMKHLKTDSFVRFRLGVGRDAVSQGPNVNRKLDHRRVIQFVLSRFRRGEAGEMKHLVKHGMDAVRIALLEGLDKAKNRFH
ncbi:MAG: aminoacyl-tRNA hydrolase [Patescibacteria group bacterium]